MTFSNVKPNLKKNTQRPLLQSPPPPAPELPSLVELDGDSSVAVTGWLLQTSPQALRCTYSWPLAGLPHRGWEVLHLGTQSLEGYFKASCSVSRPPSSTCGCQGWSLLSPTRLLFPRDSSRDITARASAAPYLCVGAEEEHQAQGLWGGFWGYPQLPGGHQHTALIRAPRVPFLSWCWSHCVAEGHTAVWGAALIYQTLPYSFFCAFQARFCFPMPFSVTAHTLPLRKMMLSEDKRQLPFRDVCNKAAFLLAVPHIRSRSEFWLNSASHDTCSHQRQLTIYCYLFHYDMLRTVLLIIAPFTTGWAMQNTCQANGS